MCWFWQYCNAAFSKVDQNCTKPEHMCHWKTAEFIFYFFWWTQVDVGNSFHNRGTLFLKVTVTHFIPHCNDFILSLSPSLSRSLQHLFYSGPGAVHADPICRLPAHQDERAHGCCRLDIFPSVLYEILNCCWSSLIWDQLFQLKYLSSSQHVCWNWVHGLMVCVCFQVCLRCFRPTPSCSIWKTGWPDKSSRRCSFWESLWLRGWFSLPLFTWPTQVSVFTAVEKNNYFSFKGALCEITEDLLTGM